MIYQETLILLTEDFTPFKVGDVTVKPFNNNGNWLLPLGWESELDSRGISYTVQQVDIFIQDHE